MNQTPQSVTICVLGSQHCGQTLLIEKFIHGEWSERHLCSTSRARHYHPIVLFNYRIYHLRIVDCPPIPFFPANSLEEWSNYRNYALSMADAFLLVFDATSEESYHYARFLQQEIMQCQPSSVIVLAANKMDRLRPAYLPGGFLCSTSTLLYQRLGLGRSKDGKKQGKSTPGVMECSAQCNWRVNHVFKQILKRVDENRDAVIRTSSHRSRQSMFAWSGCSVQ